MLLSSIIRGRGLENRKGMKITDNRKWKIEKQYVNGVPSKEIHISRTCLVRLHSHTSI